MAWSESETILRMLDPNVYKWSPSAMPEPEESPKDGQRWMNIDHPDTRKYIPQSWRERYLREYALQRLIKRVCEDADRLPWLRAKLPERSN